MTAPMSVGGDFSAGARSHCAMAMLSAEYPAADAVRNTPSGAASVDVVIKANPAASAASDNVTKCQQ